MNKNDMLTTLLITLCFLIQGYSQVLNSGDQVPGTIVSHQPASSGMYIGSPSLAILPNGNYVAAHDFFGPNSSEWSQAQTQIYSSMDKGQTWNHISTVTGAFWSSLFVHRDTLYLLGPDRHHGTVMIRKSPDGGKTWSHPTNERNGVILRGEFHCAPMPVVHYNGRLWRPMETAHGPVRQWGKRYGAMILSAPEEADLLRADSWQTSNVLYYDSTLLDGQFSGWLEGNFVVGPDKQLWEMLRVSMASTQEEKAAMVRISDNGKTLRFDPEKGFIDFPGGSKKFVIKYDDQTDLYWTLVNNIPEKYLRLFPDRKPGRFRNVLTLRKSKDLIDWKDVQVILEHNDVVSHGFQYVDWSIEGEDLIFLSRTAFFDGKNQAHNNHDANFLTFHRIRDFRKL